MIYFKLINFKKIKFKLNGKKNTGLGNQTCLAL